MNAAEKEKLGGLVAEMIYHQDSHPEVTEVGYRILDIFPSIADRVESARADVEYDKVLDSIIETLYKRAYSVTLIEDLKILSPVHNKISDKVQKVFNAYLESRKDKSLDILELSEAVKRSGSSGLVHLIWSDAWRQEASKLFPFKSIDYHYLTGSMDQYYLKGVSK